MKSKLCISPIISVILILVVTTISVTSFLSWYSSYESNLNTKIESTVIDSNSLSIETIAGSVLYVKSNENTTIKSIKLDNNICSLDLNLTAGINEIDISTCLNNLTRSNPSVSLVSDNQILSKNIYIKTAIINSTSQVSHSYNNCSIGHNTILHGESQVFYLSNIAPDGCINQTRTCNNGNLNGSYEYLTCIENLVLGGNQTYDINIDDITYRVHEFISVNSTHELQILVDNIELEYLMVGGGDYGKRGPYFSSGGRYYGGAGGNGGEVISGNIFLESGIFPVTIGVGGEFNWSNPENSIEAGDTLFAGLTATGAGGALGGTYSSPAGAGSAGSASNITGTLKYYGGAGGGSCTSTFSAGGNGGNGGGGAGGGSGEVRYHGWTGTRGGNGAGDGIDAEIGGWTNVERSEIRAGLGGGAGFGGGGGGGGLGSGLPGKGGSGVLIIRYRLN